MLSLCVKSSNSIQQNNSFFFRLPLSSTSPTESLPNRLVIAGSSSSSRSNAGVYDDPYVHVNALSTNINAQTTTASTTKCDSAPSTSSLLQPIRHSVRDLLEPDGSKRMRLDRKFDIDDTCSNDAFIFNATPKENPLKSNQKPTTVRCNVPK